jgi:hypothetical protein
MSALLVSNGQIGNEFLSQKTDLALGYHNVVAGQFVNYRLFASAAHEKTKTDMNQNVVSKRGSVGGERTQLSAMIHPVVTVVQNRFPSIKWADVHGNQAPFSSFQHFHVTADIGIKIKGRTIFKQTGRANTTG